MSLLACEECGGKVSSKAGFCPHCGAPVGDLSQESSHTQTRQEDLATANRLSELNARIVDFERVYPNHVNGRGLSPFAAFLLTILCFAVLGGILCLYLWHNVHDNTTGQLMLAGFGICIGLGVVVGLYCAAIAGPYNSRCAEYTRLVKEKESILHRKEMSGMLPAEEIFPRLGKTRENAGVSKPGNAPQKTVAEDEANRRAKAGFWQCVEALIGIALIIFLFYSCRNTVSNFLHHNQGLDYIKQNGIFSK